VAAALESHLTATIGSVSDPGPDGVPAVNGLFRRLKAGYTWAEVAYMAVPCLSWQTVVIGDPLYAPLK
jgi:hypothetical protein